MPTLVIGAEVLNHLKMADLGRNRFRDVIQVVGLIFVEQVSGIPYRNRKTQVSVMDVLAFVAYPVNILDLAGLIRLPFGDE